MNQEHAFALATEQLLNINIPIRAQHIRVLFSEIGRILNHMINACTSHGCWSINANIMGLGRKRKINDLYERACGSRLHAAYFRTGGVHQDIDESLINDIYEFCDPFLKVVDDLESLLTENRYLNKEMLILELSLRKMFRLGFNWRNG